MELTAILIAALSAPAVTVCAAIPWPWVLAVSILSAAVLMGQFFLRRAAGKDLPALAVQIWGRPTAGVLFFLMALTALGLMWRFLPASGRAFPEAKAIPFVPLSLLAVAAWSAWHGQAAVLRAAAVLFIFLTALYGAVFLFALPDAEMPRLASWHEPVQLTPLSVLLLPVLGVLLPQRRRKAPILLVVGVIVLPTAVSALCAAVPGSRGSFYEMAKSIEVFSVTQRLEPLVSALLTIGWFAAIALLPLCVGELASALGLSARYAAVAFCALGIPGCLWDIRLPDGILAAAGAVFCVLFPALTLFLGARKKL